MTEEGVNGLSLAEVARRLGVQPPSLYKYFPSLMAIYDALFYEGQRANLEALRARHAGGRARARRAHRRPRGERAVVPGQPRRRRVALLASRPSFHPSPEAFAVSTEMVQLQRGALADAVAKGQLGPGATEEGAIYLVSTLIVGVLSQAFANEPDLPWGEGRFTPMFTTLMRLLPSAFPPGD